MERTYFHRAACESIVYREPGKQHGDGQQDTDEHPVYLHYCGYEDCGQPEWADTLPEIVDCGCLATV